MIDLTCMYTSTRRASSIVRGTSVSGSGATLTDAGSPLVIESSANDMARGFSSLIHVVQVYNQVLISSKITALADTSALTAPSGITPSVVSSSQINLAWTESTDNVGVTGYLIETRSGVGCANCAKVGTSIGTTYSNTGLTFDTSYSYRARSTDSAGNLSAYSPFPLVETDSLIDDFDGAETVPVFHSSCRPGPVRRANHSPKKIGSFCNV